MMRPCFLWTGYLLVKGVALLALSALTGDPIGLLPGAICLALSLPVGWLESRLED
jgi:hypothetical protein